MISSKGNRDIKYQVETALNRELQLILAYPQDIKISCDQVTFKILKFGL